MGGVTLGGGARKLACGWGRVRQRRTCAGLVGGGGTCGAVYELKLAARTKPLCLQHELNLCVCSTN